MSKVVLDGLRKKILIKLPLSGGELEMWDYPLVGDVMDNVSVVGTQPQIRPLEAIVKMIISWNFTDEAGNELPITEENVKKLPVPDFVLIAQKVEQASKSSILDAEEKKSTLASST